MGFFKKLGKMAKRKMSFKNMIKMANPLHHIKMLNPKYAFNHVKGELGQIKELVVKPKPNSIIKALSRRFKDVDGDGDVDLHDVYKQIRR